MRLRQTMLTVLLACLAMAMRAQDTAKDAKIVVWLKDGSKTEVLFNQMPEFLYADGRVSLQNGTTELSWLLADLKKFTFEDVRPSTPTAIKDVAPAAKLDLVGGCAVYDLNGRLVKKHVNSLTELPKGVYVVNDGSVTTKVIRK